MRAAWLSLLLVATGCTILDLPKTNEALIAQPGVIGAETLASGVDGSLVLVRPGVRSLPLDVTTARDTARFGVVLADARDLPPGLRPPNAPEGGVLVTRLECASPLAIAGVRPFDRIRAVNGATVATVAEAIWRLRSPPGHVAVDVTRRDGTEASLAADVPAEPLAPDSVVWVPFTFTYSGAGRDHLLGIGPFDGLFTSWTRHRLREPRFIFASEESPDLRPIELTIDEGWSALFYALRFETLTRPERRRRERRIALFWIPISLGEEELP